MGSFGGRKGDITPKSTKQCPRCKGKGGQYEKINNNKEWLTCHCCDGVGRI